MTHAVRPATSADAPVLAELRYEFRSGLARVAEPKSAFVARCTAWMGQHLAQAGGWRCWVWEGGERGAGGEGGGRVDGHLWLQVIEKVPNPVAEPERHAYITNLYVRPAARGGAGSRLLETALGWCRDNDIDCVILWPTPESRSLYLRHGFAEDHGILAARLRR